MIPGSTRERIGNEYLAYLEKRESEETQANHFLGTLMDSYPLLSVSILTFDKEQSPVIFAHRGLSGSFLKSLYAKGTLPVLGASFSGETVLAGDDPRLSEPEWRFEHECKALYGAPCRIYGKTVGVFVAEFREPALNDSRIREAFGCYAQMSAILLALKGYHHTVERMQDLDSLTGLGTFKTFHEAMHKELSRAKRSDKPVSLIFIKVRFLRELNDIYGHVAADQALIRLSHTVRSQLRESDFIARSGSSLYIMMPDTPKEKASTVASRIASAMDAEPAGEKDITLKVAVGVSTFPSDGVEERVLITHTEAMVQESVRKKGNAVSVFGD